MFILSYPLQIAFLFALLFAYFDIKDRKVSAGLFEAYFAFGLLLSLYGRRSFTGILLCAVPGVLFLLVSLVLKGQIGAGDALYLILSSLYLTFGQMILMLSVSWLGAGIISLFMILSGKRRALPFLAFMPFPIFMYIIGGRI